MIPSHGKPPPLMRVIIELKDDSVNLCSFGILILRFVLFVGAGNPLKDSQ
jgi:hypothetical protein